MFVQKLAGNILYFTLFNRPNIFPIYNSNGRFYIPQYDDPNIPGRERCQEEYRVLRPKIRVNTACTSDPKMQTKFVYEKKQTKRCPEW